MIKEHIHRLAKILRTDSERLALLEETLGNSTGKKDALVNLVAENDRLVADRLGQLGLTPGAMAHEVFAALNEKIKRDDAKLYQALGQPLATSPDDWQRVLGVAVKAATPPRGFFLKKEKAVELLKKNPPQKIMAALGYADVDSMLAKEDLFEVFSALRFIEGSEWLNAVFFKPYEALTPSDFEERDITVKALPKKWQEMAEGYVKKKYHNISHLKELGVLFVIPLAINVPGETIRNFSLVLHYLYEIPFYSGLIAEFAKNPETFAKNFTSLLRGDVYDERLPQEVGKTSWLVVQRYLAKDDEFDWRLFEPRLNPEARHWTNAEEAAIKTGDMIDGFGKELEFWRGMNWVGDYFKEASGTHTLVSFNLVDTAMALVMEKTQVKYLYHHQEALWNRVFISYFGLPELERMTRENIIKGWFTV